ncbi:hydroxypyruvate isomerase [Polynucleobacter bastaniensis]|jgi:hydroxypyruvate isomerase|uniref:hydroxypyruvate isomerase n=1 Tax=Polynucleobacter bastaniensis TaxID=2081039 RepID=UPI001C0C432D|nr:hydroxypyruvate isomerase [Polynucleobacter bastaniensis]MBU3598099.1 hydroxypyruvate isomerase [Polynucleobacter bastaniensis]
MPKFAANLTMLFNEKPFLERFALAKIGGFKAVEFLFPYAFEASEIKSALDNNALKLVLHNLPAGDWDAGERGIACHPDRVAEFRSGVAKAIEYATILGVPQLNCLAGKTPEGVDPTLVHDTFVSNLQFAAAELKKSGLKLLIEPINTFDIPGFYLSKTAQGIAILDAVAADNAFLQYDIYHAQRMEGELANTIQKYFKRIAHIQLADNPGRNEPGTGEINYSYLFDLLARLGYTGYIGCEYKPLKTTEAGLHWMGQYEQ